MTDARARRMPEGIAYDKIESALLDAAVPIILAIISGLFIMRFARPLIRRILRGVVQSQTLSAAAAHMTAADIKKRVDTLETLGASVIRFVLFALVLALTLAALNLGWIIGAMGVVFAAIAFAGQDFVRDYLAGVFIMVENQFYVGDVIRVGEVAGTVEDFTLRKTTLRDIDGALHIVSNGTIRVATNLTRGFAGINLNVPIAHDADVDTAMAIIGEVGKGLVVDPAWAERILEAPRAVRVDAFGEMGITLRVLGRVRAGDQWAVTGELRRRVLAAFAQAGIGLPQTRIIIQQPGI
jgi:small conductance mechanosensitive channel